MARRNGIISDNPKPILLPETQTLIKFREKLAKNFIDILILKKLRDAGSLRGCGLRAFIRKEFQIPLDINTIYLLLHSLEENGLIRKNRWNSEKAYTLTKKGKETIETLANANEKIQLFVGNIF